MTKTLTNNQLLMRECIAQEFKESSTYAEESTFFEFFSASQILKNYNLTDDEIDDGLTGGGNDGGCDSIYLFLNGDLMSADQIENITAPKGSSLSLVVIQSKNSLSFGEEPIMKFKTTSENLLSLSNSLEDFLQRYNDTVISKIKMFRDALTKLIRNQIKILIQFFFVTLGNDIHPNVLQQSNELKKSIKDVYPSAQVEFNFIGADKLMEMYNTDVETSVNLKLSDPPIALGEKVDYVALVNIATYYDFITNSSGEMRKSFFEANVRDYQGNNSVNSSIAETLSSDMQEDFWWLNNGVTVLASKVVPITNRELQLLNPEIVNGLQTSMEIYNYFSKNACLLSNEKRNLLVRIIVPESEESRDNIIYATNNQTSISKSSLRVTDPIHRQIEMYFKSRGLYYDRRKNYYKNLKKKPKDIISVSFLAQCLISVILKKPDFARARPSTLLTDDNTYKFLYEDNHDLAVYYKIATIGKRVQLVLKRSSNITPAERSDILFYLLYAVVATALNKKNISFEDIKNLDIDLITSEDIILLKDKIFDKYKELGGNGRVAKSASFTDCIDNLIEL